MMENIFQRINNIVSIENEKDFWALQNLVDEIFQSKNPEKYTESVLQVFERFPENDESVFWGILHGLETLPNYEEKLIESVQRKPSLIGLLMINRLINSGKEIIGGIRLLDLLSSVSKKQQISEIIKSQAENFLEYQQNKIHKKFSKS